MEAGRLRFIVGNMTPADAPNITPEPRKSPLYTLRVLCIVNGPAITATQNNLVAQANAEASGPDAGASAQEIPRTTRAPKRGSGWFVVRESWAVQL